MTIGDRHLGTDTIFWIKKAFNAKWVSVPKCLSPIVLAMTLLFIIPAHADITNGLVAHYTFDEGAGTIAVDASGNNNVGTLLNAPTWAAGKVGKGAISFDGVDDSISVSDSASISLTKMMTLSIWFKTKTAPGGSTKNLISKSSSYSFGIAGSGATALSMGIRGGLASDSMLIFVPTAFNDDAWHYFVATFDGDFFHIYLDGVLINSKDATRTSIDDTANALIIGNLYAGALDDLRIYNRALSLSEISDLYASAGGTIVIPPIPTPEAPTTPVPTTPVPTVPTPTIPDPKTIPPPPVLWTPPIGIPEPSFGIKETHFMYQLSVNETCVTHPSKCVDFGSGLQPYRDAGAGPYTHYVDNTDAVSTDTNNPYGTKLRPRKTMPNLGTLPAGSVVEIHGGPYAVDTYITTNNGEVSRPIFFRGPDVSNRPVFKDRKFMVRGHYIIVENIKFDGTGADIRPWWETEDVHHVSIRHCEAVGEHNGLGTASNYMKATPTYTIKSVHDVVFYNNYAHLSTVDQMEKSPDTYEEDNAGVYLGFNSSNVWVVDNDISGVGGDAVGGGHAVNYTAHNYYIGRNKLHHTGENAIDFKEVENIVVSENKMYDFKGPSLGSDGTAVVIHYGPALSPKNTWFLFNEIYNSTAKGIQVGGDQVHESYFIGNIIHDIHNEAGTAQGFTTWNSNKINMINNIFYNVDNGISASGHGPLVFQNNIIANVSPTGSHVISLGDSRYFANLVMDNNIFYQPNSQVKIRGLSLAQFQASGKCLNCVETDPMFVDAAKGDFHLKQGSPAIDKAVAIDLYQRFKDSFGIEIRVDHAGGAGPVGSAWDIGVYESGSSSWTPPIGIPDPKDYFGGFDPIRTAVPNPVTYCPNWSVNLVNSMASGQASDCYYINNADPLSTDSSNAFGSPIKPRKTIPRTLLSAGSYVEVHGDGGTGNYSYTNAYPQGIGTPAQPIWYVGVNKPIITGILDIGYGNYPSTKYMVFDSLYLRSAKITVRPRYDNNTIDHMVFRNIDLNGSGEASNGGFSAGANLTGNRSVSDIVVYNSSIYNSGDKNDPNEECGVAGGGMLTRFWVLDNSIHDMAEDGVAGGHGAKRTLDYYYIGRNEIYNNITNAIDIKHVNHVVISENIIHDHYTVAGSSGPSDSVILHYAGDSTPGAGFEVYKNWPADASVLFNTIYNSVGGIRTSKTDKLRIVGNVIYNIKHDPMVAWDAGTPYAAGAAIHLRGNLDNTYVVDNTLYGNDMGIEIPGGGAAYSPTTTYYRGNNAIYANAYYVVINDNNNVGISGIDPTNSTYWKSYKAEITGNIITHRSEPTGRDIFISDANTANYWLTIDHNLIYSPGGAPSISYRSSTIRDLNWLIANSTQCDHCLSSDPLFVSPPTDFSIQKGSSAINAGVLSDVYQDFFNVYKIDIRRDILGNIRPAGGNWDIGAYESGGLSQPVPSLPPIKGLLGDVSGDGKVTMFDAALVLRYTLGSVLTVEQEQRADINVNGKIDGADVVAIAKKALGL